MSTTCDELTPAIAALAAGLPLEPADRTACEEHSLRCPRCASLSGDVVRALAAAKLEPRFAPDTTWDRIAVRLREERARALATPALKVLLSCTFCHAALDRREATYCAACLAPHHAECFETHGRCSATGCSETHTVSPKATVARPRRSRLRALPWLLAGVGIAGAAAFGGSQLGGRKPASSALAPGAATDADVGSGGLLFGDVPGERPTYPREWSAPAPGSPQDRLETIRLTARFADTPVRDALDWISQRTGVRFTLDISMNDLIDNEQLKVGADVEDVRAWDLVGSILEQCRSGNIRVECTDQVVRFTTRSPRHEYVPIVNVRALLAEASAKALDRALLERPIKFHFQATPLGEAVRSLREQTGIAFAIAHSIDAEQIKVSIDWDGPLQSGLDELFWATEQLAWEQCDGAIWVIPREESDGAWSDEGFLDTRGLSVPKLMGQLMPDGLPSNVVVVATERAWRSLGSVALVTTQGATGALAAITPQTGLTTQIIHTHALPYSRAVIVLDGEAPGLAEARTGTPAPYPGVVAEVRELRQRLEPEVAARRTARNSDGDAPEIPAEIARRECAVTATTKAIVTLLRRSREIASAGQRLPAARQALEREVAAAAEAAAAVRLLQPEVDRLEFERRALASLGVDLRRRRLDVIKDKRPLDTSQSERSALDRDEASFTAASAAFERRLVAFERPSFEARSARTLHERAAAERRLEIARLEADVVLAKQLERGARLSADER